MKSGTERKIMRWIHIILSIPLIGYFYGPVATQPYAVSAIKYVFLPVVVISGCWMWKGQAVKKWWRKTTGKSATDHQPQRIRTSG